MVDKDSKADDRIIPPDKLELTPEEAKVAQRIVDAAADPVPTTLSIGRRLLEGVRRSFTRRSAQVDAQWPPDDKAPDYHHFSPIPSPTATAYKLRPEDIEFVLAANRFDPHGKLQGQDAGPDEIIAIAVRGLSLGSNFQIEKAKEIDVIDIRPNHHEFRCAVGFYLRTKDPTARRLTLYTGSTVPNPYLMTAYRDKVLADPNKDPTAPSEKCNMLPTGCYVCRVDHHKDIKPALRMVDPANLVDDAKCVVVRTFNDLMYGTDDFWDPCDTEPPTDNVHCSYQISFIPKWRAPFSSEGCITVRGKPDPTDQWAKFQSTLRTIGMKRRCDLVLITGRDLGTAASYRIANPSADPSIVPKELARLRSGSNGEEVRRLRAKLGMADGLYFGPELRKRLADEQLSRGVPIDGIYSPTLDGQWGWNVFASVPPPVS